MFTSCPVEAKIVQVCFQLLGTTEEQKLQRQKNSEDHKSLNRFRHPSVHTKRLDPLKGFEKNMTF